MRPLTYILTFIISATLTACGQTKTKSNFKKSKIDIEAVDYIEINNKSKQLDAIQLDKKLLTVKQTNEFVIKWNNSKSVGPIKSMTKFFITVQFKDGTTRKFTGSGQYLKEGNDFGFDLGDSKYLEALWNELNIDNIKNIRYVFEDYINYQESTDSEDDKGLMTKSLKSLSTVTKKDDLDLLINVWMYYDPTDYPGISEIYRILKDSRPHSITAVKNRIDNKKEWETDDTAPYSDLKINRKTHHNSVQATLRQLYSPQNYSHHYNSTKLKVYYF